MFAWFSSDHHASCEHRVLIGHGVNMRDRSHQMPMYLPDSYRQRHTLVTGPSGVGKTRMAEIFIKDDVASGKSMIYFDPKHDQDVASTAYAAAREAGRLDDFMIITPIFPSCSAKIDPMSYAYMPEELVNHVVSGIPVAGENQFFRDTAKQIAMANIMGNILLAKAERRKPGITLDSIYRGVRKEGLEQLKTRLLGINSPDAQYYVDLLEDVLLWNAEHYSKVSSSLRNALISLTAGNVGKIIGRADTNRLVQRLEEGKRVIAVVQTGSMISYEAGATLGRVLLSMIQSFIGRVYSSKRGRVKPALSLHIDEAPKLMTPDSLMLLDMAGSADVMAHLYAQDVEQIHAALGNTHEGKAALANLSTKIFFRAASIETAQYIVDHFGTHEVLTGVFSPNQVTTRQVERPILKVEDVMELEPRQCYMTSRLGRCAFTTLKVAPSNVRLVFPDAPADLSGMAA